MDFTKRAGKISIILGKRDAIPGIEQHPPYHLLAGCEPISYVPNSNNPSTFSSNANPDGYDGFFCDGFY